MIDNPDDVFVFENVIVNVDSIFESPVIKIIKKALTKANVEKLSGKVITIPEDVDVIGPYALEKLTNCTVIIPENVKIVGQGAFYGMTNCIIYIKESKLEIDNYVFASSKNSVIHLYCFSSVINQEAFSGSHNLTLKFYPSSNGTAHIEIKKYAFCNIEHILLDFTNITNATLGDDLYLGNPRRHHVEIQPGALINVSQLNVLLPEDSNYIFSDNTLYKIKRGGYLNKETDSLVVLYCDKEGIVEFDSTVSEIEEHSMSDKVSAIILATDTIFPKMDIWHEDGITHYLGGIIITYSKNPSHGMAYNMESSGPELFFDKFSDEDVFNWIWENYIVADDFVFYNKTKTRIISHMDLSWAYSDGLDDIKEDKDDVEGDDWYIIIDNKETFTVPDSVKVICNRAFVNWYTLEKIILSRVSCIGKNAFAKCYSLKHIDIPEGVKSIEEYTFYKCISLKSIKLPNSLEYIQNCAFEGCQSLTGIEIPANVKEIKMNAFHGCIGLQKIVFKGEPNIITNVFGYDDDDFFKNITYLICPTNFVERNKSIILGIKLLSTLKTFDSSALLRTCKYYLFIDTETTGLPDNKYIRPGSESWPRMVQLAWIVADETGKVISYNSRIIKPQGFLIPDEAQMIHKISTSYAHENGESLISVLTDFLSDLHYCSFIVGHNVMFDVNTIQSELIKSGFKFNIQANKPVLDTMKLSKDYYNFTDINGRIKYPTLSELYHKLCGIYFTNAHNALRDVYVTKECFFKLKELGVI